MIETADRFPIRISERLRHKDRAVNLWDYERLLLDQFPQVYTAKCLPVPTTQRGEVHMVVIPDVRRTHPADRFQPRLAADELVAIDSFLTERMPSVARIVVKNAHYRPVQVQVAVRLRRGYSERYYKDQINLDLQRALSPWAFDGEAEIMIGRRVYANTLVNALEERPYVDYVAHVRLFTLDDAGDRYLVWPPQADGYHVATKRPDEVLCTVRDHTITLLETDDFPEELYSGIGYMRMEYDFYIGSKEEF
jgi:hypothetical protein